MPLTERQQLSFQRPVEDAVLSLHDIQLAVFYVLPNMLSIHVRRADRTDFPFFLERIERIDRFRNRCKTRLYRLPVGHININAVDTEPLQAGVHLLTNRLGREIFIQLAFAHFIEQATFPLPDNAAFGFNNNLVARQFFQRLTHNLLAITEVVARCGINQINAATMRFDNGVDANLQIKIAVPCRAATDGPGAQSHAGKRNIRTA
ncbi:hypothetical protein D3C73_1232990 [compost metagenome]